MTGIVKKRGTIDFEKARYGLFKILPQAAVNRGITPWTESHFSSVDQKLCSFGSLLISIRKNYK